jgi:PAS domain-containing protein
VKIAEHGPDLASLQELVDSVPALIHTARPDGYFDFFNQRWLEYVGLRLEDLEGWKWTAALHPDEVSALSAETYRIFGYDEGIKPTLDSVVRRVHPEDRADFQRVVDAPPLGPRRHSSSRRIDCCCLARASSTSTRSREE